MSKRNLFWMLLGGLFFFLVNYPFLQIFNSSELVSGFSPLACYLFGIWIGAIVLLLCFAKQKPSD
jgi:ABC-type uncharacterized transport system permease subunit